MKEIEILPHTADVGFIARGKTIKELFENSLKALIKSIGDYECVINKNGESIEIELEKDNLDFLLHQFLEEIIYWFDQGILLYKIEEFKENEKIKIKLKGVKINEVRDCIYILPKAVTWNDFYVKFINNYYEAKVIIDV